MSSREHGKNDPERAEYNLRGARRLRGGGRESPDVCPEPWCRP